MSLARTIGVSANTALSLKHKLQQTMKNRDDSQPLKDLILIDDAYWGGKKHDGKRGRGASGKTPFLASLSLTEKGRPLKMRLSRIRNFSKLEAASWSKKHIKPGSLVVSDGLKCFPGVVDAKCQHEAIVTYTGAGYDEHGVFRWLNVMIGNVKNSLHATYHKVSEKHLPRCLAEFCYGFNRRFELDKMVNRLAYIAMRTLPIPMRILKLAEVH